MAMRNLTAGEEMVEMYPLWKNAKKNREEAARTGIKPMTDWVACSGIPVKESNGNTYYRFARCLDGTLDIFTVQYDADEPGENKWCAWFWHTEYKDYPIDNYKEMLMNGEPLEGPGWDEDDFNLAKIQIESHLDTPEVWAPVPEMNDVFFDYLMKIQEYVPWEKIGVKDIYGNNPGHSIECFAPFEDIKAYAEKLGIDLDFRRRKDHDDFSAYERAYPDEAKYLD